MGKARLIAPVETMQEKYETYAAETKRLKKALDEGFYFEAMLTDYALMEDRLRSFVYHAGLLADRNAKNLLPNKEQSPRRF